MSGTDRRTRILIADDQALFADSLMSVIGYRAAEFEVIGVAKDGTAAIEAARSGAPDIILMDIRMPGIDGVHATRVIHAEFPSIKIIVLTSFDDDEYIHDALENGAVGYILKDIPVSELLSSLRAVLDGAVLVSPAVARKLVGRETAKRSPAPSVPGLEELGRREREILALLARGLDNAQIARELFLGEQTVKNYIYGIYSKLGEHNRVRVAEIARKWLGDSPTGSK
jgi:DNA-binding NarL/FixJ family response regulator